MTTVLPLHALLLLFIVCNINVIQSVSTPLADYCISHDADPILDHGVDLGNITLPDNENELRFLSIGDWGTVGAAGSYYDGNYTILLADIMGEYAEEWNPHFVVSVGDHFYETDVDSTYHPRWNISFEDVFDQESLKNIYWYGALGNHAYDAGYLNIGNKLDNSTWDDGQNSQIYYTTAKENIYKRWCLPSYYYQFSYSFKSMKVRFIAIDSLLIQHCAPPNPRTICRGNSIPDLDEFYDWTHETFKKAAENNEIIVILSHYTFVSNGKLGLKNDKLNCGGGVPQNEFFEHFTSIMLDYKVSLYIAGHEHNTNFLYAYNRNDDTDYSNTDKVRHKLVALTTGAFGQMDGQYCGNQSDIDKQYENSSAEWHLVYGSYVHGFAAVTINTTHLYIEMIGDDGIFAKYSVDMNELLPGDIDFDEISTTTTTTSTGTQIEDSIESTIEEEKEEDGSDSDDDSVNVWMIVAIIVICLLVITIFIVWQYHRSYGNKRKDYSSISTNPATSDPPINTNVQS